MPNNVSCFPWSRYWFPEGRNDFDTFIYNGYLTLPSPEYTHYLSDIPRHLSELTQYPVLILLGDPGCGKSYTLADEKKRLEQEQAEDLVSFVDLKIIGPGEKTSLDAVVTRL